MRVLDRSIAATTTSTCPARAISGDQPPARLPGHVRHPGAAVRLLPPRRHLAGARRSRPEPPARRQAPVRRDALRQRQHVRAHLRPGGPDRPGPAVDDRPAQPDRHAGLLIRAVGAAGPVPGRPHPDRPGGDRLPVRHLVAPADLRQRACLPPRRGVDPPPEHRGGRALRPDRKAVARLPLAPIGESGLAQARDAAQRLQFPYEYPHVQDRGGSAIPVYLRNYTIHAPAG